MEGISKKKHAAYGALGSAALLAAYFAVLGIANSPQHAVEQFASMWPLMSALVAGFGIQAGLFTYIREASRLKAASGAGAGVAATGGISGTSMVLCCLHHAADVLPIIGLSAAALFLVQYQAPFLVLGIGSSAVGIAFMLETMQKNGLSARLAGLRGIDMAVVKKAAAAVAAAAVVFSFYYASGLAAYPAQAMAGTGALPGTVGSMAGLQEAGAGSGGAALQLGTLNNSEAGVSIEVTPVEFAFGKEAKFDVRLTTHSGSLDFEVDRVSALYDSAGKEYAALSWEGSPPGGHHRSGTLVFPAVDAGTDSIRLVIRGIYGVGEREFVWELA